MIDFFFFDIMRVLSSSVNPIIYAYSSREFRRAFIKYLCRCFPIRIRNLMMSYHNLHLLRYRRGPESNLSKDNVESASDPHHHLHNHNNNNNNNNHLTKLPISNTPSPTTITLPSSSMLNKSSLHPSTIKHLKNNSSKPQRTRLWFFSPCCRTSSRRHVKGEGEQRPEKRSSSTTSSRATVPTNVLVDYCTYHDVAVSRVTCL